VSHSAGVEGQEEDLLDLGGVCHTCEEIFKSSKFPDGVETCEGEKSESFGYGISRAKHCTRQSFLITIEQESRCSEAKAPPPSF